MNIAQEITAPPAVRGFLDTLFRQALSQRPRAMDEDDGIMLLREHFCCKTLKQKPENVYASTCNDFFLRYGLANLVKNYYLLSELYLLGLLRFTNKTVDLGCGPGIFALARLLMHITQNRSHHQAIDIALADCTQEFLSLFGTLWETVKAEEKKAFSIRPHHALFDGDRLPQGAAPDVIVFSNSLCEMLKDPRVDSERLVDRLVESQAILFIIDYQYEETSSLLKRFTEALGGHYTSLTAYEWPQWNEFFQSVDLGSISYPFDEELRAGRRFSPNVEFLKAVLVPNNRDLKPGRPEAFELVMRYKAAWERHDTRILSSLFTEDALYREKPEQEPFRGLESIRRYWRENARLQRAVTFTPLYIEGCQGRVKCVWKSRFFREDIGSWMALEGTFTALVRQGKFQTFDESFEKSLVGVDA